MRKSQKKGSKSPLLNGEGLPEFKAITPEVINNEIPLIITSLNNQFNSLEKSIKAKCTEKKHLVWDDVMTPLYKISEKLRWSWGVISHLNAVSNSDNLREAYSNQQPEIIKISNKIGQSKIIHSALKNLTKTGLLNEIESRIIESQLLHMKHKGVSLNSNKKEAFNNNSQRLGKLSTKFSNNVLDATKDWSLLLTEKNEIDGLPERTLISLARAANDSDKLNTSKEKLPSAEHGPWLLTLDMPTYISFMTYSTNRKLREKLYKANISKASNGDFNNENIIKEILTIRKEQANLLGYKNWAELSLATKMANNVQEVEKLLNELCEAAYPVAKNEIEELEEFISKNYPEEDSKIMPWDLAFWSEKLKKDIFNLDQEALRPWFPLPEVLNGLFKLCERLFEIKVELANKSFSTWHEDVKLFNVFDKKDNNHIASFFLDPYARPSTKRNGAWMDECLIRERKQDGEIILPVAYLVCNQTPPIDETPSLMSFEEVETLFHEFGHGLQHMLTTVDYPQAAGINNVEWDAVELPSQFMENWCRDRSTLLGIAKHWKTGEKLPIDKFNQLIKSSTFHSGLSTLRQIHFAMTDIKLHSIWHEKLDFAPDDLRRSIAKTTTVIPPINEDRFLCAFSHIFAGGYAAGYYSYKWAEVLSADAFAAFEEVGLENKYEIQETGLRYKNTILSLGGSVSPIEIFERFRGRPPMTNALIKHSGLDKSKEVAV